MFRFRGRIYVLQKERNDFIDYHYFTSFCTIMGFNVAIM